jgi:long-chain acyl-CoA synthetase
MKNIPLYEVRQIKDLRDMIHSSAELFGDKAAFLVKRKGSESYSPVSYRQFSEDVDALGTALLSIGLKGTRIALLGENRYEWAVSYLATANGTGVVVPLDKELPANELESLLARSKSETLIYSSNKENITDILKRSRVSNISSI